MTTIRNGGIFGRNPTFSSLTVDALTVDGNINLSDNNRINLGDGSDLSLYHDGSNSRIVDSGTGSLVIQATNFALNAGDNSDNFITTAQNAGVSVYYNGSKKVETTNSGTLFASGTTNLIASGGFENGYDGSTYSTSDNNYIRSSAGSSDYAQIRARNSGSAATSGIFAAVVNGSQVAEIEANGDFLSATGSYTTISDENLKENIVASGSQWSDIKAINIVKYSMKADELDQPDKIGVIAQQLETAGLNGLVTTKTKLDRDDNPVLDEDNNPITYKTVKQSVLYMKAIKALQEAMTRIEQLEQRVTDLGG